jgi:hypothetical protein
LHINLPIGWRQKRLYLKLVCQFSMNLVGITSRVILVLFALALQEGYSQELSNRINLTVQNKEVWFDTFVTGNKPELVNGREYFTAFNGATTNPFFGTLQPQKCQLWYDEQYYPEVNLLLDCYVDKLVLRQIDKGGLTVIIELDQNKVEKFILGEHLFKKINIDNPFTLLKGNNFYDVLYEGKKINLVAKRKKVSFNNQDNLKLEYRLEDEMYILYKGKFIPAKGTKGLLSLMGGRAPEAKVFMNSRKLPARKISDASLRELVIFCDSKIE